MADTPPTTPTPAAKTPAMVSMPKAKHEIHTGKDKKIDAGELVTAAVAKEHKLDNDEIDRLVSTGALVLVEVLKG